jgi:hypothetical protein
MEWNCYLGRYEIKISNGKITTTTTTSTTTKVIARDKNPL